MLYRLVFYCMCLQSSLSGIRVAASLAALQMDGGATQVGLLLSSISLFPMFLAIPVGQWIDVQGARRPIFLACAFFVAATLIPSLAPLSWGFAPLYAGCILAGLGFLLNNTVAMLLVGTLSTPENRTTNFSWFAVGYSLTGLVMPPLMGHIIDWVGVPWAFRCCLAFSLLGTCCIFLERRLFPLAWTQKKAKRSLKHPFALFSVPRVRNVLIVSGIVSMAWDIQNFMFPVFGHAVGLSASEIGWLIGTFFAASFVVRFFMPWLARHLSEWRCLTLALVIGGGSYLIFPFLNSMAQFLPMAFILGLGIGGSQPNVMSLLHSQSPAGRVGEAIGVRTMLQGASHSLLPMFFGVVTVWIGTAPIFLTMAALMGGCAWLTRKPAPEK